MTTDTFLDIIRERGIRLDIVRGKLVLIERSTHPNFFMITPKLLKVLRFHRKEVMALIDIRGDREGSR